MSKAQDIIKNNNMKKILCMLILSVISCKTVADTTSKTANAEVLLTYSKGACLGKCPVYDLKILKDGMLVYEGINKVEQKGIVMIQLTSEQLTELKSILTSTIEEPEMFKRVRDRPVTVLHYDTKRYEFHSTKLDGKLKLINAKIENLVAQVNTK